MPPVHQRDIEGAGVLVTRLDLGDGAWVEHTPGMFDPGLFGALRASLAWKQEAIRLYGREVMQPRLTAWYGEPGAVYTYSGRTFHPLAWTGELLALRSILGGSFNSCLCNLYRDGRDSIGLHADDEPELGARPTIASVSLGSARKFVLREVGGERRKLVFELGSGDLLVMGGTTQRYWKHEVRKTAARVGERINLTFRQIQVGRG